MTDLPKFWHAFIGEGPDGERAVVVFGEATKPVGDRTQSTQAMGVTFHYAVTFDHAPTDDEKEAIPIPDFSLLFANAKQVLREYRNGHQAGCLCRTCERAHLALIGEDIDHARPTV